MKKLNTVIIGCVKFSYSILKELNNNNSLKIVAIVTKKKSKIHSDFYSLREFSKKKNIPYFISNGKDEKSMIKFLSKFNLDLGFCIGWSHILSPDLLCTTRIGFLGYHPAELPKNKGRHPIIWSLALGLSNTASTFYLMDKLADNGDIVDQRKININNTEDAKAIYDKLTKVAKIQVTKIVKDIAKDKIKTIKQKKSEGNYWRKRSKLDGKIDWRMNYQAIYNLVRALCKPYPGAYCSYNEKEFFSMGK